ncbi:hypothetical protein NL676_020183 [Syzygium grande]|nr:hypothetical protein NL676_020183 [Syzygium grande]
MGVVPPTAQLPYGTMPYQPGQMMGPSSFAPIQPTSQPQPPGSQLAHNQLAYQQIHQQQQQQLQQQLQSFWANQYQEIDRVTDFKNHSLPLARIKKIMKADEDVRMISAEAPIVFARACEMFILELTLRSWNHTEENKRRTLQKNDIAAAITRTDVFDFLVDIVPREELKEEVLGAVPGRVLPANGPMDGLPYCYVPPQQVSNVPRDIRATAISIRSSVVKIWSGGENILSPLLGQLVSEEWNERPSDAAASTCDVQADCKATTKGVTTTNDQQRLPRFEMVLEMTAKNLWLRFDQLRPNLSSLRPPSSPPPPPSSFDDKIAGKNAARASGDSPLKNVLSGSQNLGPTSDSWVGPPGGRRSERYLEMSSRGKTNNGTEQHIDPQLPILDVAPLNSVPYFGPPISHSNVAPSQPEMETEAVESVGPSIMYFPSHSTEEWDKLLAAAKSGIGLVGSAAMGRMGPVVGAVDIGECEDSYLFRVSLPGVSRDEKDFRCDVEPDGKIFIKGVTTTGPVNHQQLTGFFGTNGILEGIVKKRNY